MKIIKFVSFLLVATCITSFMNVKADGYLSILSVTLPSWSGNYLSSSATKTTISDQYVKSAGAVDNLSGDGRAVEARVYGINTYTTLVKNSNVKLYAGNTHLAQGTGSHRLEVRSVKSLLTTATWSGTWIIYDYLLT